MSNEIREWLEGLGLGEYAEAFLENKIDLSILPDLTGDDLKDIGVAAVGDRRRLMAAIERLDRVAVDDYSSTQEAYDASRRQVTVLFADLAGFTSLTNSKDVEETHALLNRFFVAVAQAVGGSLHDG